MADQHDSAQRSRPFAPPVPPFRGPATGARPGLTPLSQPNGSRPPAPFVARRAAKVEDDPDTVPAAPQAIPAISVSAAPAAQALELQTPPAAPATPAASAVPAPQAGADAHLYGHDPFRVPTPVHVDARIPTFAAPVTVPDTTSDADSEDATTALAGLPYFDDTGSEHRPNTQSAPTPVSGKVHRVEFDPAAVLESIAVRIRSGLLALPDLDPLASDEATLAAILSALLRDSRR